MEEKIIEKFKSWGEDVLSIFFDNDTEKYIVETKDGYKFDVDENVLSKKNMYLKVSEQQHSFSLYNIKNYLKINDCKTEIVSDEYKNNNTILTLKCKCGKIFERKWLNIGFHRLPICTDCVVKEASDSQRYSIERVRQIFQENGYTLLETVYKNNSQPLHCKDSSEYHFKIRLDNLKMGQKPMAFNVYNPYIIENMKQYIINNKIKSQLISNTYYIGKKLKFRCECGRIYKCPWASFYSSKQHRCSFCAKATSKYEQSVILWLEFNGFEFKTQVGFDSCKYSSHRKLKFDFQIYHKKDFILCEIDGRQHFEPVGMFGGEEAFRSQLEKDNIKNQYCMTNNIQLLRIPYWEFDNDNYIKILEKELNIIA